MEAFFSGYCRCIDGARTVTVDTEDNCADCAYPDCPHKGSCPIAEEIAHLLNAQ